MDALFAWLEKVLSSQPIMQAFAGFIAIMVVAYMVMRGKSDAKDGASSPVAVAPGNINSVPPIFAQGPSAMLDTVREMRDCLREARDYLRELTRDVDNVKDDVKGIREELHKQTGVLEAIEREQAVSNRAQTRYQERNQ